MLIYSAERYVPTDVNILTIRAKFGLGYIYVHRSLYDKAVVLSDLYKDKLPELVRMLTGNDEIREDVQFFYDNIPEPINILGAFLSFITKELEELEDMVGAIHVMSGPLDFRRMIQVPFEIRQQAPRFSLSIKEEYQLSWERFFTQAIPYRKDMFQQPSVAQYVPQQVMQGAAEPFINEPEPATAQDAGESNEAALVGGVDFSDPSLADWETDPDANEKMLEALNSIDWDSLFDMPEEGEEKAEDATAAPTVSEPEPVATPEPEPEPTPEPPKQAVGVEALLNL